jgi:hypothetical protein
VVSGQLSALGGSHIEIRRRRGCEGNGQSRRSQSRHVEHAKSIAYDAVGWLIGFPTQVMLRGRSSLGLLSEPFFNEAAWLAPGEPRAAALEFGASVSRAVYRGGQHARSE